MTRSTSTPENPSGRRLWRVGVHTSIVLILALLGSREADALSLRVTELSSGCSGPEGVRWCPGSPLTIGLRIESDPSERIQVLGLSAHGYNDAAVDFVSGSAVSSIFHAVAVPGVGAFDGLANVLVPTAAPGIVAAGPLAESAIGANGNRVSFFSGVALAPRSGNPLDPGIDGVIGGGDAHVRLTFALGFPGQVSIDFGAGYFGDGIVYAGGSLTQLDFLRLTTDMDGRIYITPEPGSAVLIGLGLVILAGRRHSRPDA